LKKVRNLTRGKGREDTVIKAGLGRGQKDSNCLGGLAGLLIARRKKKRRQRETIERSECGARSETKQASSYGRKTGRLLSFRKRGKNKRQ